MKTWADITDIGLFVVDELGHIVEYNKQFSIWFSHLKGKSYPKIEDILLDEQSVMKYHKFLSALKTCEHESDWEINFNMGAGKIRLLRLSGGLINNRLHGSLVLPPQNTAMLQNVTQSINSELAALHRENTRKNVDLNQAYKALNTVHEELDKRQKSLDSDLMFAKQVQRSMMRKRAKKFDRLEIKTIYSPAASLGGDLFDIKRFDDDMVGVFICDVSGHGIASSLVVSVLKYMFRDFATKDIGPNQLLEQMNESFVQVFHSEKFTLFCTAFYVMIDLKKRRGWLSSAGHPYPILYRKDAFPKNIGHPNLPVGVFSDTKYDVEIVDFEKGDKLLLFTDGLEDLSENQIKDNMKHDRQSHKSVKDYFGALSKNLNDIETLQNDDICAILVEFLDQD